MEMYPPIDFVAAGWLKANKPKPFSEQAASAGLPLTKGKVKKRGDIGR
jgi:hypothetical protein